MAGVVVFARRWRLSDQRIRVKLTLILVLPLLAIVTLAGLNVMSEVSTATSEEQARQLAVLGARSAELAEHLQGERAAAALVFVPGADAAPLDDYRRRAGGTDAAIQRFRDQRRRGTPPRAFQAPLSRLDGQLADLRPVRQQVLSAPDAVASVVAFRYRVVIADLLRFRQSLSQLKVSAETAGRLRATAALGTAAEALGMMQTTVVRSLATDRLTPAAQGEIVAADASFTEAIGVFRSLAPGTWISRYNAVMTGTEVLEAERLCGIVARMQPGPMPELGTDAKGWVSAVRARMRLLHAMESELDAQLVADIERQRDAAHRDIGMVTTGVGLALLCMIALGAVVARSLTRSLTSLRATAETIAHTRLPEMVAQVSAEAVDLDRTRRMVTEVAEPIPVLGHDEVGQVAAAFNAVTASAVRLAGEQAALRGGVRAIFNSLSRRSQRRLNTVMTSIDSLQAKETDPDQLEQLFRLDHAATGLRRLTAGLQVLAGGRAGLARPKPMVLGNVLRAAQSEIDQYQRIDIGVVDTDVELHGETVEEVIHLLAELLDNAARFSAPSTLVIVEGRRVGDRLHIQITDDGKGMTEAQLAAARDRLANPHRLDHHTAQQMGLPVVSAIADRLGIVVALRPAEPQGTRVDLTLPPTLFRMVAGSPSHALPNAEPGVPALPSVPTMPALSGSSTAALSGPSAASALSGSSATASLSGSSATAALSGSSTAAMSGSSAAAGLSASSATPTMSAAAATPALSASPVIPGADGGPDPTPRDTPPRQTPSHDAGAVPATTSTVRRDGETTLELLELGSGWPSTLSSWSNPESAAPQPTTPRPTASQPTAPPSTAPQPLTPQPLTPQPVTPHAVAPQPVTEPVESERRESEGLDSEHPEPAPEIYRQLKHAWFAGSMASADDGTFAVPANEQPTELTGSGLPKRRRSATTAPAGRDGANQPAAPSGRDDASQRQPTTPAGRDGANQPSEAAPPSMPPLPRRSPNGPPAAAEPPTGPTTGPTPEPMTGSSPEPTTGPATGPSPTPHPTDQQPVVTPSAAEQRRNRDSDQLRRRYAGLERGLIAARRRVTPSLPEEEQQP